MKVSIIVAFDKNRLIGNQGEMPWNIPTEMEHFKETTIGFPVIMGRKTYDSIGKPLKGRINCVLSRNWPEEDTQKFHHASEKVFAPLVKYTSLESCLRHLEKTFDKVFIIGGAEIYKQAMPFADEIIVSKINNAYIGDTYFPEIDKSIFKATSVVFHLNDIDNDDDFDEYEGQNEYEDEDEFAVITFKRIGEKPDVI